MRIAFFILLHRYSLQSFVTLESEFIRCGKKKMRSSVMYDLFYCFNRCLLYYYIFIVQHLFSLSILSRNIFLYEENASVYMVAMFFQNDTCDKDK